MAPEKFESAVLNEDFRMKFLDDLAWKDSKGKKLR